MRITLKACEFILSPTCPLFGGFTVFNFVHNNACMYVFVKQGHVKIMYMLATSSIKPECMENAYTTLLASRNVFTCKEV